jgi:NADPH:quinone reductase-like Zn-dependent oxidoreductase
MTAKRGVDVCIDSIGKAVHMHCIKSMARGGVYVTCGTSGGADAVTDLMRIFWNQLSILGSTMGDMNEFREVAALLRSGSIKPVIDSIFDADEAPKAYARLESAEQFGKIVIRW